jgi:hypothetical protein
VDALGNPVRLILTGGQVADITQGAALIEASGAQAIIPPRKIDWHRYKAQNLVE